MKTSDILLRAAEVMIERGHTKGQYVSDDGHVCILGAVCFASGLQKEQFPTAYSLVPGRPYLDGVVGGMAWVWNDRDETTEAMAIGALHEAALLAKEQGD